MASKVITAAGGIVWRKVKPTGTLEVLLVHRPGYDDWTFPKGKSDPGEILPVTAVREIYEETGYRVRLSHPLPEVNYRVKGGEKRVSYWLARTTDDQCDFRPNREVDRVKWFPAREARRKLTYDHDRMLLERFEDLVAMKRHKSRTLIVLRHGKAISRADFKGQDRDRPLAAVGADQAKELVKLLSTYGTRRVISSDTARTVSTVEPFLASTGELLELDDRLGEGASGSQVDRVIESALSRKRPTVICSHRPVLADIFGSLGVDPVVLNPGQALVVHHRSGRVLSTELV